MACQITSVVDEIINFAGNISVVVHQITLFAGKHGKLSGNQTKLVSQITVVVSQIMYFTCYQTLVAGKFSFSAGNKSVVRDENDVLRHKSAMKRGVMQTVGCDIYLIFSRIC